jgi:hypothetical protein
MTTKRIIVWSVIILVSGLVFGNLLFGYEATSFVKSKLRDRVSISSNVMDGDASQIKLVFLTEYETRFETDLSDKVLEFQRTYGPNKFNLSINNRLHPLQVSYFKDVDWSGCEIELKLEPSEDSIILWWKRSYRDNDAEGVQRFSLR